jgi:hypothetical protein
MFRLLRKLFCPSSPRNEERADYWERSRKESEAYWAKRKEEQAAYWDQQRKEMRERHAREIFARVASAGCIVNDDSTVDGIKYGDLWKEEQHVKSS